MKSVVMHSELPSKLSNNSKIQPIKIPQMKKQSFQTKRLVPGGGLFVFHSKTLRRKKQRVAASADLASEVPNLGVARALFVILVLHVAAIAAIFIHNRVTDDDIVSEGGNSPKMMSATTSSDRVPPPPVVKSGETFYFVATGDTYARIARLKGVDVQELRDLNNGKGLDPGAILRIPAGKITVPGETASDVPGSDSIRSSTPSGIQRAIVVKPETGHLNEAESPSIVSGPREVSAPVAGSEITDVPRAIPVPEDDAPVRTYAVKSGDTAWKIAKQHNVPVQALLKANSIEDARKLQVNMKLRIPTR